MEKRGPHINHLSFEGDVIIFTSGTSRSLELIVKTLSTYERVSGQLVNRNKSHFLVTSDASQRTCHRVQSITGFSQKKDPVTYLGCPLYIGRQKVIYFSDMVSKVTAFWLAI